MGVGARSVFLPPSAGADGSAPGDILPGEIEQFQLAMYSVNNVPLRYGRLHTMAAAHRLTLGIHAKSGARLGQAAAGHVVCRNLSDEVYAILPRKQFVATHAGSDGMSL
jgi:hypothetical protein